MHLIPPFHISLKIIFSAVMVFAIALSQAFAQSLPSQIHPKAQELINNVRSMGDKPFDYDSWSPDKGPWADYFRKSYVDRLTPRDKELYGMALEAKDCRIVGNLQRVGFLRSFPFLKEAHRQAPVSEAFRENFLNRLPDYLYCSAWNDLERVLSLIKAYKLDILPFDFSYKAYVPNKFLMPDETLGASREKKSELKDRAHNSLCLALSGIVYESIDQDIVQAVKDVLHLSKRSEVVRYSKAQLYYIHLRAKQLNILPDDGKRRLKQLSYSVKPALRNSIDIFLENRESSTKPRLYDLLLCQSPRLTIRERLSFP